MKTWVIGAGGLFGSALVRASSETFTAPPIPWNESAEALTVLATSLGEFREMSSGAWCIFWAAGHATTSSTPEQADKELALLTAFLNQHLTLMPAHQDQTTTIELAPNPAIETSAASK